MKELDVSQLRAKRINDNPKIVRILVAGRAFFFDAFDAVYNDEDKPEEGKSYKTGIYIPKKSPVELLRIVTQARKDAIQLGIETRWNGSRPSQLRLPIRDGDEKYKEDKEKYVHYKDMFFLNAKRDENRGRPALIAYGKPVTEAGVIEGGDWCLFDITFFPYKHKKGGNGVGAALNGVTLITQGERFGGGPSAEDVASKAQALYGDLLAAVDPLSGSDDLLGGIGDDDLLDGLDL